jgi:Transposase DDE domain group 1
VRLQLHALAYNLANFLRTLALPERVEHWSLTTLREKLVKIGARIVRHGRYVVFQLAEVAVPRALFADILRRIDDLRPRPPPLPRMNDDSPSSRGASMTDREPLQRSDHSGRKPQITAVGGLWRRPRLFRACLMQRLDA